MNEEIYSVWNCPKHQEIINHCRSVYGDFKVSKGNNTLYNKIRNKIYLARYLDGWFEFFHEVGHKTQQKSLLLGIIFLLAGISITNLLLTFNIIQINPILLLLILSISIIFSFGMNIIVAKKIVKRYEIDANQFARNNYIPILSNYCLNCNEVCFHKDRIEGKSIKFYKYY